jgi:glycosyltransferase involved in cell wall biosynthesis
MVIATAPTTEQPSRATSAATRVVMFVRNDCTTDVRVLREAATLHASGRDVTIMALQPGGKRAQPDRETRHGVDIVRVPSPTDWSQRWWTIRHYPWRSVREYAPEFRAGLRSGRAGRLRSLRLAVGAIALTPYAAYRASVYLAFERKRRMPERADDGLDWLVRWRYSYLGWAQAAAAAAPAAAAYHGHDLYGLPAALAARRLHGGTGAVVYDSHELFMEAGSTARRSRSARSVLAGLERRWLRQADGLITVNESIAVELHERYGGADAVVIRNTPPRQPWPDPRPDHLRRAAGIPPGAPIVLYHGGFQRDRGLEVLAEAMLDPRLATAHLFYLGFGGLTGSLEALAVEPRFGGRLHVLPGVPPEDLLAWVASADVSAMPNQPATLNERYSSPNKLYESIAVGTPVVGSDFPERRRIVTDDPDGPLGGLCDPTDPRDLARALSEILELDPAAAEDLRRRCHRAATLRWNWEIQADRLLALYARLAPIRTDAVPARP